MMLNTLAMAGGCISISAKYDFQRSLFTINDLLSDKTRSKLIKN